MKKKTTKIIICGIALILVIVGVIIAVFTGSGKANAPTVSDESDDTNVIVIDTATDDEEGSIADVEPPTDEPGEITKGTDNQGYENGEYNEEVTIPDETLPEMVLVEKEPGGKVAQPIIEKEPVEESYDDSPGISIGADQPEKYSCGSPGHHCDGPETHAYVLNLEIEGCPYCGKHICPSFYAVDEWGNTCYTPRLCPEYDMTKDPALYCQICGRKCGDGSNGTCVQFVTGCKCPLCGEQVEAWTCHTCK